jgi:hypothetical protein
MAVCHLSRFCSTFDCIVMQSAASSFSVTSLRPQGSGPDLQTGPDQGATQAMILGVSPRKRRSLCQANVVQIGPTNAPNGVPQKVRLAPQKSKYEIICHLLSSGCAEPSLFLGTDAYPLRPQPAPSRWGRIFTRSADPLSLKHGSSRKNGDGKYSDVEPMLDD